jgi:hypothetical protein
MKKLVTMREALRDRHLLADALPGPSWSAWRVVEPAIYSKQMGWVGAGTTNAGSRSTTQAYYDWMNSGAAYWPGSGPKEW